MLVVVKRLSFFQGNVFFSCTLIVFREGEGNGVIPPSKKKTPPPKKKVLLLPFLFSHRYEGQKHPGEEWVLVWMSDQARCALLQFNPSKKDV